MTMTTGERMIWAAAFVAAYNRHAEGAVRLDMHSGAIVPNDRACARTPLLAVIEAARMVIIARNTLPQLVTAAAADTRPGNEEAHREAVDMLREMLGVDASGNPYR